MEVDNIEVDYNKPQGAGNPNRYNSQDSRSQIRQSQGVLNDDLHEINNSVFFTKQPQRDYPE